MIRERFGFKRGKSRIEKENLLVFFFSVAGVCLLLYALWESQPEKKANWKPINDKLEQALEHAKPPSVSLVEKDQPSLPSLKPDSARQAPPSHPAQGSTKSNGLIDINHSSPSELQSLPGIGPSKARAIVEYRNKIGGFRQVNQLKDVKGIGPKVFAKVSSFIFIGKGS